MERLKRMVTTDIILGLFPHLDLKSLRRCFLTDRSHNINVMPRTKLALCIIFTGKTAECFTKMAFLTMSRGLEANESQ